MTPERSKWLTTADVSFSRMGLALLVCEPDNSSL